MSHFKTSVNKNACIRKRRHCAGHNKGLFKCTRFSSSIPGTFSVLEEQSTRSPASISQPGRPFSKRWWIGPCWMKEAFWPWLNPERWWLSSGPRLSVPTSWIIAWQCTPGLCRRSARLLWAMFYIEFLLVVVGSHWGLVGKHPLILHPAAEPAPVG